MNTATMNTALIRVAALLPAAFALVATNPASAQPRADYPSKPIRFVVPFVPGGPMDMIGRLVGQKFLAAWGHNVIIDNRAGAGGIIGTEIVAKSPPDGYTVLHTSSAHSMLPAFNKLPYDSVRDFAAISTATRTVGYVLGVHPSIPINSVTELIALAKKNPGRLNYGNTGIGGVLHVGTELFSAAANIKMTTVLDNWSPILPAGISICRFLPRPTPWAWRNPARSKRSVSAARSAGSNCRMCLR